jgi:hypothetical protein
MGVPSAGGVSLWALAVRGDATAALTVELFHTIAETVNSSDKLKKTQCNVQKRVFILSSLKDRKQRSALGAASGDRL